MAGTLGSGMTTPYPEDETVANFFFWLDFGAGGGGSVIGEPSVRLVLNSLDTKASFFLGATFCGLYTSAAYADCTTFLVFV